jgi:hypothetical protein
MASITPISHTTTIPYPNVKRKTQTITESTTDLSPSTSPNQNTHHTKSYSSHLSSFKPPKD